MSDWLGDFSARWRQSRDRSRARRAGFDEAVASVRAAAAGKSRSEARDLLAAELRARELASVPDPVVEYLVDRVLAPDDLASQARLMGRGLGMVAEHIVKLGRDVREQVMSGGPHLDLGDADPLLLSCDRSVPGAEVVLEPDAQQWLDPRGVHEAAPAPQSRDIFVLLGRAETGHDRALVAVRAGDHHVGLMTRSDSEAFLGFVDEGARRGQPVVTEALCARSPDGAWRLNVYRPRPGE